MAIWRATLNFLFSVDSAHPTATDLEAVATLANTSATTGDGSGIILATNEGDSATGLARAKVFAKRAGTGGAGEMSLSTRSTAGNMTEAVNISTTQDVQVSAGDLSIATAGKGLKVKEGSNATMGRAVLVAGTVTVSTTKATSTMEIFLTRRIAGGTLGHLSVGTVTGATSFVINSSDAADTSTINWLIIEPA